MSNFKVTVRANMLYFCKKPHHLDCQHLSQPLGRSPPSPQPHHPHVAGLQNKANFPFHPPCPFLDSERWAARPPISLPVFQGPRRGYTLAIPTSLGFSLVERRPWCWARMVAGSLLLLTRWPWRTDLGWRTWQLLKPFVSGILPVSLRLGTGCQRNAFPWWNGNRHPEEPTGPRAKSTGMLLGKYSWAQSAIWAFC